MALLPAVSAQDQERKLVDRLLKPDTTLENNAQNKKFVADGTTVDKRAMVSAFYTEQKPKPTSFAGSRKFSSSGFNSRSFDSGNRMSVFGQRQMRDSSESYSTASVSKLPNVPDSHKNKGSRSFAGQRPFLERGKSQKSLERHNPSLTIEQVR